MNTASLIAVMATAAIPITIVVLLFIALRWWRSRTQRRSPLYGKLHHGPGEQLRKRIQGIEDDMEAALVVLTIGGPLLVLAWALPRMQWDGAWTSLAWYVAAMLVMVAFLTPRLWRLRIEREKCRDGLAAELMAAQQLAPLAASGCVLLNDIPAKGFNLDHVVVGPRAVFLVETKSCRKPREGGSKSAQVHYDGKRLQFPGGKTWVKPLEQARHQARWLADHLKGFAGEPVPVVPVVALPGWYVNYGKDAHRAAVRVINPKMHDVFSEGTREMPDNLRNRVIRALTERYPDVES